jgi:hypothetical protein
MGPCGGAGGCRRQPVDREEMPLLAVLRPVESDVTPLLVVLRPVEK